MDIKVQILIQGVNGHFRSAVSVRRIYLCRKIVIITYLKKSVSVNRNHLDVSGRIIDTYNDNGITSVSGLKRCRGLISCIKAEQCDICIALLLLYQLFIIRTCCKIIDMIYQSHFILYVNSDNSHYKHNDNDKLTQKEYGPFTI